MKRLSLLLSLLAAALMTSAVQAGLKDGKLDIYWIDVEGGASTLIVTPAGETVLIDTGNPGPRDPGRIVKVVTEVAQRAQIDHLIITHYHGDHFGGAATLATLLPIRNVYDNGKFEGMPNGPSKDYLEFKCDKRQVINPGDSISLRQAPNAPALSLRCLGTRQSFVDPPAGAAANETVCAEAREKNRDGSDNANSVVTLLGFGGFRFFDAGDLTWNQEARLVCPVNLVGQVDVYQVTHHGLDSSNNPLVVRTLAPSVAVMNNGVTKGCSPEVYQTLTEAKSIQALYQVHKNLRPDGAMNNVPDEYIANKEMNCQGHYIHLAVDPDGKKYTVSIPAHGHERTFQTRQ